MSLDTLKTKVEQLIEKAQSGGNTDELEAIIDNSGVLDSTEGTVEEKVEQLVEKAEDENLWYRFSEQTTKKIDMSTFDLEKLPRMNPINTTTFSYSFSSMPNLKSVDFYINSVNVTNFNNMFSYSNSLEYVKGVNTSKATNVEDMFRCEKLKIVEEPLDFSSLLTKPLNAFRVCPMLEEVRIVKETIFVNAEMISPKLSAESIQSIIDGLAIVETAQTLTLHADVKAKLTQAQLDTITGKNWNLA